MGSPPPMRGKVGISYSLSAVNGITPAYAGKSLNGAAMWNVCTDHPRLCGEKVLVYLVLICHLGSPPPMRGKAHGSVCHLRHYRITPAYAGKRGGWQPKIAGIQDHPRLCGEKFCDADCQDANLGSPPPMRGKD